MAPSDGMFRAHPLTAYGSPPNTAKRARNPARRVAGRWPRKSCRAPGWALSGLLASVLASACAGEPEATLVALAGCGLDEEGLTEIRVRVRGDFPTTDAPVLQGSEGHPRLDALPEQTAGITVEGLVGEAVTTAGRTARLEAERDDTIPVYFAPEDQLCAGTSVGSGIGPRLVGAMAVGPRGDVLIAGGRTPDGKLVDDLVRYRDVTSVAVPLSEGLPVPSTGHTLHPVGERSFLVLGGAGSNPVAFDSYVLVELAEEDEGVTVEDPRPIDVPHQPEPGRAHHAAAVMPDGSVLVAGGCSLSDDGECVPEPDAVLGSAFLMIAEPEGVRFDRAAPLVEPRYDAHLRVGRDGVAFIAGGRGPGGDPVLGVERLLPGHGSWEAFGPQLGATLPEGVFVIGAELLEGGLVVLAMSDGSLWSMNEQDVSVLNDWCLDTAAPCFVESPSGNGTRRDLLALPGERIVADAFVLPVALLDQTGLQALDLSEPLPGRLIPPPGQRRRAATVVMADGSVLFAGGVDPIDDAPAQPFFVRMRPQLDGPDERIPDIDALAPGSLVLHFPARFDLDPATGVAMVSDGEAEEFPRIWAHVRGFRSASFRFDLSVSADATAYPHIVLSQGAVAGMSVRFDADRVHGFVRDSRARAIEFTCSSQAVSFAGRGRPLRVDVTPGKVEIRSGTQLLAQCPGPGEVPMAVGFGASGSGIVTASGLRLTRI